MKLIKITTDNEISVHEFPEGNYSEQNEALAISSVRNVDCVSM